MYNNDIDIILEAYNNINIRLIFENNDENALKLAKEIDQRYRNIEPRVLEQWYGDEARTYGFMSVADLLNKWKLYKRIFEDGDKSILKSPDKPKPVTNKYSYNKHDDYNEIPHNIHDIFYGVYVLDNVRTIGTGLNLISQIKKLPIEFKEINYEGEIQDVGKDFRIIAPSRINNRGEYRVVKFKNSGIKDEQDDGTLKTRGIKIIDKSSSNFDINVHDVAQIDIDNSRVIITLKYPLSEYN